MIFLRLIAVFTGVLAAGFGTSSAAQVDLFRTLSVPLRPTFEECQRERLPTFGPLQQAKEERLQCYKNFRRWAFTRISECNTSGLSECASISARECKLDEKIRRESELCWDRYREHQAQEAERRRLEAEEQRAEEERARAFNAQHGPSIAAEMAGNALGHGRGDLVGSIAERYIDPNDPTRAAGQVGRDGRLLANQLGVPTTSAMRLSSHLSTLMLARYNALSQGALGQFDAATGSGAFNVDTSSGQGGTGSIGRSTQLIGAEYGYPIMSQAEAAALVSVWQNGDVMDKLLVAATVFTRIAAAYEQGPVFADQGGNRPSLVEGTFARNVNRMVPAAVRGEVELGSNTNVYSTIAQVTTRSLRHPAIKNPIGSDEEVDVEIIDETADTAPQATTSHTCGERTVNVGTPISGCMTKIGQRAFKNTCDYAIDCCFSDGSIQHWHYFGSGDGFGFFDYVFPLQCFRRP